MEQQRYFYKIQETALLVAANWDIQGQIQKRLTAETSESDSMKKLEALYGGVDTIIKKINSGKFRKYIDRISDGKDCNKEYRLSVEKAFDNLFVKPKVTLSVTDAHLSALFGMMFGDTESSPGDSVPEPEAGSGPASLQQQGSSSNQ